MNLSSSDCLTPKPIVAPLSAAIARLQDFAMPLTNGWALPLLREVLAILLGRKAERFIFSGNANKLSTLN